MLVNCPHCSKQLKLGESIIGNLRKLPQGKTLKVQCVHCKKTFGLNGTTLEEKSEIVIEQKEEKFSGVKILPPQPPDLDWLSGGAVAVKKAIDGIPRALVIYPDLNEKKTLIHDVESLGYQVEEPEDLEDALGRMFRIDFSLVFYHARYSQDSLEESAFHKYVCQMPMTKRRDLFYVLIGDQLQTLYSLQALVYSANLVVNDKEVQHIGTLLKKAIPEYEELFGAYMEELRIMGK